MEQALYDRSKKIAIRLRLQIGLHKYIEKISVEQTHQLRLSCKHLCKMLLKKHIRFRFVETTKPLFVTPDQTVHIRVACLRTGDTKPAVDKCIQESNRKKSIRCLCFCNIRHMDQLPLFLCKRKA